MTVIAFDGNMLVADRQANTGTEKNIVNKLHVINDGLIAISGNLMHGLAVLRWLKSDRLPENYPVCNRDDSATVALITKNAEIFLYEEKYPFPLQFFDNYYTSGSGGDLALGAMAAGLDALEAAKIAVKYNSACGCGFSFARLDDMIVHHIG